MQCGRDRICISLLLFKTVLIFENANIDYGKILASLTSINLHRERLKESSLSSSFLSDVLVDFCQMHVVSLSSLE